MFESTFMRLQKARAALEILRGGSAIMSLNMALYIVSVRPTIIFDMRACHREKYNSWKLTVIRNFY